jgi:hypothetical protein
LPFAPDEVYRRRGVEILLQAGPRIVRLTLGLCVVSTACASHHDAVDSGDSGPGPTADAGAYPDAGGAGTTDGPRPGNGADATGDAPVAGDASSTDDRPSVGDAPGPIDDISGARPYHTPKRAVDSGQPFQYGLVTPTPFAFTD